MESYGKFCIAKQILEIQEAPLAGIAMQPFTNLQGPRAISALSMGII
jgi:hypothetical protein